MNGLLGQRESTRNHGLAGDNRGQNRQYDNGRANDVRHHQEEWVTNGHLGFLRRHRQDHCPLPHIVQHQGWQNKEQPAELDWAPSKMPHIGIERLGSGNGKHHSAHRDKRAEAINVEKVKCVHRVDHIQNDQWHLSQMHNAKAGERCKIDEHDRPEPCTNLGRTTRLECKKCTDNHDGNGQDPVAKALVDIFQAFRRGQD